MTTRELIETYYKGLAKKQGWESVIADDFQFTGGNMTKTNPIVSKQAYIAIIDRFSKLFTDMRPNEIFTTEDSAFVLANYDYLFPNGKSFNANVAELWRVKGGKLFSLALYFDTENFNLFLKN